jgi:hypothetical protein
VYLHACGITSEQGVIVFDPLSFKVHHHADPVYIIHVYWYDEVIHREDVDLLPGHFSDNSVTEGQAEGLLYLSHVSP